MVRFLYLMLPGLLYLTGLSTEELHFDVHYKLGAFNAKVATADFRWQPSDWKGSQVLYTTGSVRATPIFRLFINSDFYFESHFRTEDLAPLHFINPFKQDGKQGRFEYTYRDDTGEIESKTVFAGNIENKTFPNDGRTMDLLSLLHFIRLMDYSLADEPMPIIVLMSARPYPAELVNQGTDLTTFPDIPAEKILLRLAGGLMTNGSGNEVYIWRSLEDHRLLMLETELSSGSMTVKIRPAQKDGPVKKR